ncbi:MAG: MotA/TolQ/ExbB proton channel family protein [Cyclobacteriaceae bacterium]|nr:MotA/TolQ/ExbB proton channel family protein [Cyclobacteriaceae bacterium]
MYKLFIEGGIEFMSILSLELLAILFMAVISVMAIITKNRSISQNQHWLGYLKSLGLLALVTGVLGQLVGLFSAFDYIEQVGNVSPKMLFSGIKVSMITTLYGFVIFIVSYILWFGLEVLLTINKEKSQS